ncbi:serine/threonine-protein kinase [Nonomuraea antri]|uniref:serine/threonine-protein kinase n=1 Tax=Nonomuraea antri TaxID=2730852 RepID=UPI001C2BE0CA|nr:serine/threonine-protein kinase [Nonomuraea antri]
MEPTGAAPLRPTDLREIGPYRLLGRLGEGGMGTVFLAKAPTGRFVAVKVVKAEFANQEGFAARFHGEVDNARRVASFCTAQVLDNGNTRDGRPYMVTEYIAGTPLSDQIAKFGQLDPGPLHGVALGVAAALAAIHVAGLVHRDLKPANVILSLSGPRVIDFGIARALDRETGFTLSGELLGSPGWWAPEQVRGQSISPAADIFAWGCLMAYAGNGRHPFGRGDPITLATRVLNSPPDLGALPAPLNDLVRRATDMDPALRPTAQDLLIALVGGSTPATAAADPPTLVATEMLTGWQPPQNVVDEPDITATYTTPPPSDTLSQPASGPQPSGPGSGSQASGAQASGAQLSGAQVAGSSVSEAQAAAHPVSERPAREGARSATAGSTSVESPSPEERARIEERARREEQEAREELAAAALPQQPDVAFQQQSDVAFPQRDAAFPQRDATFPQTASPHQQSHAPHHQAAPHQQAASLRQSVDQESQHTSPLPPSAQNPQTQPPHTDLPTTPPVPADDLTLGGSRTRGTRWLIAAAAAVLAIAVTAAVLIASTGRDTARGPDTPSRSAAGPAATSDVGRRFALGDAFDDPTVVIADAPECGLKEFEGKTQTKGQLCVVRWTLINPSGQRRELTDPVVTLLDDQGAEADPSPVVMPPAILPGGRVDSAFVFDMPLYRKPVKLTATMFQGGRQIEVAL